MGRASEEDIAAIIRPPRSGARRITCALGASGITGPFYSQWHTPVDKLMVECGYE